MCNNEYTCITLNLLTTINENGTMLRRKETAYDCYGRNAYSQRNCTYPQVHAVLHQRTMQKWGVKSHQDWRTLEDQARRFESVCRQTPARTRPEINKATGWWQTTINKFTAVSLPLTEPEKLSRDKLRCTLPICSIALTFKGCQWLCVAGVRTRKVYP